MERKNDQADVIMPSIQQAMQIADMTTFNIL